MFLKKIVVFGLSSHVGTRQEELQMINLAAAASGTPGLKS